MTDGGDNSYKRIYDRLPAMLATLSRDGLFVEVNPAWEIYTGYKPEDLNGKPWRKYIHPEDIAAVEAARDRVLAGEPWALAEMRVRCKDGAYKWMMGRGTVDREAGVFYNVISDISRRKAAEERLSENERTLRRTLEQAPVAIVIHGLDGTVEFANRKFVGTFGYALQDIPTFEAWARQAYPEENYRGELAALWAEWIERSMRTGLEMDGKDVRIVCKDGSVKTAFVTGIVTREGKVIAILDDVTAKVSVEKSLRESESLYRALVETTRTGYVVVDGQGRVQDANREYVRLSGYKDLKEIMGRSVLDWTAPYEQEKNAAAVASCARDGSLQDFEVDYVDSKGRITPIEINATVVDRGGVPHILSLCRDISARRRTESELRQLNQDLESRVAERTAELTAANLELTMEIAQRMDAERDREKLQQELVQSQKMEAVGRLAAGIAHDFNNILVAISGYAEYLTKTLPAEAAKSDLAEILHETERGALLTRQLTAIGRRHPPEKAPVDINPLAEDSCRMLARLINPNLHIKTVLADGVGLMTGDPGQVSQVIMNLVLNSRDAMPDGGDITVSTGREQVGSPVDGAPLPPAPGAYVTLEVADTGSGMDAATAARVFEPFFSTKEEGKGSGLGLSTVYGIVKQSGGGITMRTAPGKGTAIKVYFPALPPRA